MGVPAVVPPWGSVVKTLLAVQETVCIAGDTVPPLGRDDPLEEETATHSSSSVVAWKIPGTEEPGQLQSTGSQRFGHN